MPEKKTVTMTCIFFSSCGKSASAAMIDNTSKRLDKNKTEVFKENYAHRCVILDSLGD